MGPGPARRWPLGLLGLLVLIAAIESILGRWDGALALTGTNTLAWREAQRAAAEEVAGRAWLAFGDSQIKLGVLPPRVQERLGRRGYNLAVPAGQPVSSYLLLRRALKAGAHPEAIVLGHLPGLLSRGASIDLAEWTELMGLWDAVDLAWCDRNPVLLWQMAQRRLIPSLGRRDALSARVREALAGAPNRDLPWVQGHIRNWKLHEGAQALPPNPACVEDAGRRPTLRSWAPHPTQAAYLERFLRLAAHERILVVWLLPLLSPGLQADHEQTGFAAAYHQYIRGLQARFPNLVVVDPRGAGFDRSVFYDPRHVDRYGAAALSAAMGEALKTLLAAGPGASRWVELPASDPHLSGPSPEDILQSQAAVASGAVRR